MICPKCGRDGVVWSGGICVACARKESKAGEAKSLAAVEARLREYQRALLWCYGLIQEEMSEANAEQIDDVRWLDIKRLVGEASEEVEP